MEDFVHTDETTSSRLCFIWGKTPDGDIDKPTILSNLRNKNIVQVSCGGNHSLAISNNGDLYSWGSNPNGQLGHSDTNQYKAPKGIKTFSLLKACNGDTPVQVSSGIDFSFALSDHGLVYAWGLGIEGQLANGSMSVEDLSSTISTTCSSGSNSPSLASSTSSISSIASSSSNPVVYHPSLFLSRPSSSTATTAEDSSSGNSSSSSNSCNNSSNNSSNNSTPILKQTTPKIVTSLGSINVLMLSCGASHALCLSKQGHVYSWGNNDHGKLGHGEDPSFSPAPPKFITSPKKIKSIERITVLSVSCGWAHSMLIDYNSEIYTWGKGSDGQLGNGHKQDLWSPQEIPRVIDQQEQIIQIACGYFHSAFVTFQSKQLYTFGWRIPLGHGSIDDGEDQTTPKLVKTLVDKNIKQVSCGYSHTLVVTDEGDCYSFGQGDYNQLGIPLDCTSSDPTSNIICLTPTKLKTLSNYFIETVSCGRWHSMAVGVPRSISSSSSLSSIDNTSNDVIGSDLDSDSTTTTIVAKPIGYQDPHKDIFECLSANYQSFIQYVNENNGNNNGNFDKSFFLLQDYIHDDSNSNSSSTNNEEDIEDKKDKEKQQLQQQQQQQDNDIVPTISKPFYDKYLGFFFKSKVPPPQTTIPNPNVNEDLVDLLTNKFLPKFDQNRLEAKWKEVWRKGLPISLRASIWKKAIGNKLGINRDFFEGLHQLIVDLRNRHKHDLLANPDFDVDPPDTLPKEYINYIKTVNMIKIDLPRTFPTLNLFNSSGPLQEQLCDVLLMYSMWNSEIGYVQGMSYVAAIFCLYLDTFDAFVAFTNMLNTHFFTSLYRMDVREIIKHVQVFDLLFKQHLPNLFHQFKQLELSTEHFLLEWFMTLFTKLLPFHIVCRIWDCFLIEGESFIYSASIGILRSCRKFITNSNFEETLNIIRSVPHDFKEERLFKSIKAIYIPKNVEKFITSMQDNYHHNHHNQISS
ncbi:hypothetical protein CYY_000476 [Polysphondylium violaceum]|uniref:Rab-GAP TBC domain-containing protein n=1 Tax=Polysphondylium violaceum TaxID=133409 RepID=A0A8J4Q1P1_9MYCE|nr:hypothetical protein CYY_000476 [Polysphondylium violaceum]